MSKILKQDTALERLYNGLIKENPTCREAAKGHEPQY